MLRTFYGDAEYDFDLLEPELINELERKTGTGIGALFQRVISGQFHLAEISETIRLALIGGGNAPQEADALVKAYLTNPSLAPSHALAVAILDRLYSGPTEGEADTGTSETDSRNKQ
jgi:hypothetical protein